MRQSFEITYSLLLASEGLILSSGTIVIGSPFGASKGSVTSSPVSTENKEPKALSISARLISSIMSHSFFGRPAFLSLKQFKKIPSEKYKYPSRFGLYPPIVSNVDQLDEAVIIFRFTPYISQTTLANLDFPVPGGPVKMMFFPF